MPYSSTYTPAAAASHTKRRPLASATGTFAPSAGSFFRFT